jgi:hypothetical protein
MLKKIITKSLSSDVNVFDECIRAIEIEHGRPVTNLSDLKKREDKKAKGDIWETFCLDWLEATGNYKNVWLFKDWLVFCSENQMDTMGLKTKQDNGIDIIAQTNKDKFVAVQCKYRKDMTKKVSWNTLSTFIGLCERTGPWELFIVMTNGKGVTRKVPKSKKDKSICIGTFRATPRTQWLRMAGLYEEHQTKSTQSPSLTLETSKQENLSNIQVKEDTTTSSNTATSSEKKRTSKLSLEELRKIRCSKFSQ